MLLTVGGIAEAFEVAQVAATDAFCPAEAAGTGASADAVAAGGLTVAFRVAEMVGGSASEVAMAGSAPTDAEPATLGAGARLLLVATTPATVAF